MIYSSIFTGILIIVLLWKISTLIKNKRNSEGFELIDSDFINKLNEGELNE